MSDVISILRGGSVGISKWGAKWGDNEPEKPVSAPSTHKAVLRVGMGEV